MAQRKTPSRKPAKSKAAAPTKAKKPMAESSHAAHDKSSPPLRLIGPGASAVGLEALREFFSTVEPDPGVAGIDSRTLVLRARLIQDDDPRLVLLAIEDATRKGDAEATRNVSLREMVLWEEKERHRLALELHDEAGQHVTAFMLGLAALKEAQQDAASQALVQQLRDLADELAQRLHGLSLQLRPTALHQHGLARALQSYVEDITHRHRLEIDYQTVGSGLDRMPEEVETVLYRVAQEAMTNVLKHANASKVSVVLDNQRDEIRLVIEDNGRGFDTSRVSTDSSRLGLRGMADRVHLADGTFSVESHPGQGTTIFVRIPLEGRERGGWR